MERGIFLYDYHNIDDDYNNYNPGDYNYIDRRMPGKREQSAMRRNNPPRSSRHDKPMDNGRLHPAGSDRFNKRLGRITYR